MAAEPAKTKAIGLQTILSAALVRANFACELDAKGRLNEAAEYYVTSSCMLADVAADPSLEREQKLQVRELSHTYMARLQKMALPPPTPVRDIAFEECPIFIMNRPLPPPTLVTRRAYWLMRTWGKTILCGGYVTPQLHIPRAMWYQSGVKLTAIPQKLECCEQVLDILLKLPSENTESEATFVATLEDFCETLDTIQGTLDKHLHCVVAVKKPEVVVDAPISASQKIKDRMRRLGSTISKASSRIGNSVKLDDNTAYVELLLQVFTKSQFLDEWMEDFKGKAAVKPKLDRVSLFFYEVICMFVLEDFNVLLNRYTSQMRGSFLP